MTDLRFLYCTENSHEYIFIKSFKSFQFHHSYPYLLMQIRDNGSSRAPKFCCPPNACETKRELREARSGYRITCPRGIRGWPAYEDRDKTRAIERWGNPQDVDAERECTSISRMHLTQTYNSLSLAQHFLFETFSCFKLNPILHAFLSFFSRCTTLEYFFLFLHLIIYIKIWHITISNRISIWS